ncbi:hypothetical protein Tco_0419430 [Tanacetum coccineum]
MATLKFASSHNMVAFLDKPTESYGFEQIVEFLNAHPIKYALTVNPTIYTSCIEQFWTTAKGKDFSSRDTPLFLTMIVQAQEQEGEEPIADEAPNDENVTTHANDPLLSDLLSYRDTKLKKRVKKLEKRNTSRTPGLKMLRKVGRTARIESSKDEGLGDQEDASKQGRKIVDIDADEEVTLIDETQEMNDDNLMFDTGVLDEQEVEVEKVVSTAEVTASVTTTTVDELTLAQTLIEIKATNPKAVTTAATTTTTTVTRPKARGVVV